MKTCENGSRFRMRPMLNGDIFAYWVKRKHVAEMTELQTYSTETFWDTAEFTRLMSKLAVRGYIAYHLTKPIGFVLFQLKNEALQLLNLVVHPSARRIGVGTFLLSKAKDWIKERNCLRYCVRESNLSGHLFLRNNGFTANTVLRGYFQDWWGQPQPEVEDGYEFVFP